MENTDNEGKKEDSASTQEKRLEGWKEIAAYAKRGVRTVQRWEKKGFPIRRHETLGNIYARPSEIDDWFKSGKEKEAIPAEEENEIVLTEPPAVIQAVPSSRRRWLWGVVGLAVIAFAVVGVLFIRGRVIPPPPTRIRSFAVLEFRNLSGHSDVTWLSTALAELLRSELETGDKLRPVSGEEVARMIRDLYLPQADGFSKATLRKISRNLRADLVILGSYLASGSGSNDVIRVQLKAQDTRTGETVATDIETGSRATLVDIVDRAGRALRAKLGTAEPSNTEMVAVKTALPRKLEAQQLYSEGLSKLRLLDAQAATKALTRAVQIEPSYALAHAALSDAFSQLGYEAKAKDEAKLAYEYSATLAPEDALLIEAKYRELIKEWAKAISIYRKLCDFVPGAIEYPLRLAHAQISAGEAEAARVILNDARKLARGASDEGRIELMEALSAESVGDFQRELSVAAQAETKARAQDARSIVGQALLRQCWAAYKIGQPKVAIEKAQEARRIFAGLGDRASEAQAIKNLADVIDDEGDHAQGRKLYEEALRMFREIGYQTGVAVTLNNMAYAVKDQGDLAGAKQLYEQSLAVARQIGDQGREALALNGIGIALWRQGDLPRAQEAFEQALLIHQQRGDKSGSATFMNNVALVLEDEGKLAEAKAQFETSLGILREIHEQRGIARNLGNLGDLLIKQGKLDEARSRFEEQVRLGQSIPETKQVAYGLDGVGNVLLAEGDLRGARVKHEEALALRKKTGEKGLVAETQLALSNVAREEGNFADALEEARGASKEFENEEEMGLAAQAYAEMSLALINQRNLPEAQRALEQAARVSTNSTDYAIKLELGLTRAGIEAASGKFDEATKDLRTVRSEAAQHGYVGYELDAKLALAEIAIRAGRPDTKAVLQSIAKEAEAKHFGLIARRALQLSQLR